MQFALSREAVGSVLPLSKASRSPTFSKCFITQPFITLRPALGLRPLSPGAPCPRPARSARPPPQAAAAAQLVGLTDAATSSSSSLLHSGSINSSSADLLLQQQQLLSAHASLALGDLGDGLETPVQLLYLLTLLGFLVVGAYLVVRQVLIRRELEEAAKVLGDRVRGGEASAEDYFELGVILLRKKLYTQATKNLERAKKGWEGEPEELAQVHNALGYAYFNQEKTAEAVAEYRRAVALQPGYVTAWNNLADALEVQKKIQEAYDCYKEALTYDPANKVAASRSEALKLRLDRLSLKN